MDLVDFENALDRHGAELDRWPAPLAPPARELLEVSTDARRLLEDALRLQTVLDEILADVPAPLGLKTRVLANLPAVEPWLQWWTAKAWRPAALALVPLVVGFGVGMNVAGRLDEDTATDDEDMLLVLFDPDELDRLALPGDEVGVEP
ncbi:MAG: hypothetical protein J4F45_06035 [Pseudomonadales bacterium]|nr:hypothetical protein [Pseudomonadales bacterium]